MQLSCHLSSLLALSQQSLCSQLFLFKLSEPKILRLDLSRASGLNYICKTNKTKCYKAGEAFQTVKT